MKKNLLLACLISTTAVAQSNRCIQQRSNTSGLESKPVTCLDTTSLERSLNELAADESAKNITYAAVGEMPGGSLFTTSLEEIKKHSEFETPFERNARVELENVLTKYTDSLYFETNSNNPTAHMEVVRATVAYSSELNKLLELSNLKPEHKEQITKAIHKVNSIGDIMMAKLESDIGNANKATQQKLYAEIFQLKETVKELILKNDPAKLMAVVNELNKKLSEVDSKLSALEKDASANKQDIAELKKQKEQLEATLAIQTQQTIQDIKNYSQFAQGMVAIYSMFDAEEASKIGNAVSGLTNMAIAYTALSGLSASAPASAAFGYYGMIAMGGVQLINSFSHKPENDAFKAIFKQLQMISKQISQLEKKMDTRFNRLEDALYRVEKNILQRLEYIGSQINDLESMVSYSISAINEIDNSIKSLNNYTVSRDIKSKVNNEYVSVIENCLGKNGITVKLKKKEITQCLNNLEDWFDKNIATDLMTKKMLPGQYVSRNLFDWQINDVSEFYKTASMGTINYDLANPVLLRDLSDNLQFLKYKNLGNFKSEHLNHTIFVKVRQEEEKLRNFSEDLQNDQIVLQKIKDDYKGMLLNIHSSVQNQKRSEDKKILAYHSNELTRFRSWLKTEIVGRGDADQDEDSRTTMEVMKNYYAASETMSYSQDPHSLIEQNKVIIFAENCSTSSPYQALIPVNFNYLEKTLGSALAKRFILSAGENKICFDVEVEKNKSIISLEGTIRHERIKAFEQSFHNAQVTPQFKYPLRGMMSTVLYQGRGLYKGDFIKSLTISGRFGSTPVFQDTFQMNERIPLRKTGSDPYALLTFLKGSRYNRTFALPTIWSLRYSKVVNTFNDSTLPAISKYGSLAEEMNSSQGGLLMPTELFTTPANVQNLRNDLKMTDHEEVLKAEIQKHNISIVSKISDLLKNQTDTDELDKVGKMMAASIYFKGGSASNELLKSSLSEVWGLKSGKYLKRFYLEVLSANASSASVDYILEDQMKHLEAIH